MTQQAEEEGQVTVNRGHVTGYLEDLAEMAQKSGLRSIHQEVVEDRLPALERGQVSLVVLGEFNHGKSTVVNALLGQEVLPMGITPTTAVITHLVHADKPRAAIKERRGGELREVAYESLGELIRHDEEGAEEPEYVEIGYPNDFLGEGLILVDTPGVNDISRQKVEITYGYLPRADVILYVLDATQVLKKSEVSFIRDRLLKANRDRILFVLGKLDALSEEEAKEVEAYARQRLETLIGPVELFAFSARAALEAQKKGQAPAGEFEAFRSYVQQFVRERKEAIVLDSALGGALRIAAMIEQNLAIKRQGYRLEQAELEDRIRAVHARLKESRRVISENVERVDERAAGIAATARHNLRVFADGFAEALPVQVERAEAKDVKRYLSRWIQDTFQGWLEGEGQEIAQGLEELAEETIEVTNQSMREVVGALREEMGMGESLDLEIDTIGYDVSVFALGTLGVSVWLFANALVGGVLTLATPILALVLKGKGDERLKDRAKVEGIDAIREATEAIEGELMRMIHGYTDRLKEFIEHAGDRLYGQIEEALEQVQVDRAAEGDREKLTAEVDSRVEDVRRLARMIKATRERLVV